MKKRPSISPAAWCLIGLLRAWRHGIAPILRPVCRFEPSCSRYAEEAVCVHGAVRGSGLALRRVLRCRPGSASGYDPVPLRGESRR